MISLNSLLSKNMPVDILYPILILQVQNEILPRVQWWMIYWSIHLILKENFLFWQLYLYFISLCIPVIVSFLEIFLSIINFVLNYFYIYVECNNKDSNPIWMCKREKFHINKWVLMSNRVTVYLRSRSFFVLGFTSSKIIMKANIAL